MAKKRVVKRKVAKKSVAKRKIKRAPRATKQLSPKNRTRLALRDLVLFAVLSLIFIMLYNVSENVIYQDMFYLLSMVFGFIALAFLIIFAAISFSRGKAKKKR